MIELILIAGLSPIKSMVSVEPCVWPNTCISQPVVVASVEPCVWPNTCASKAAQIAGFTPRSTSNHRHKKLRVWSKRRGLIN